METLLQAQQGPPKGTCLAKTDEKWQSLKGDIHDIYITKSQTLPTTMRDIESLHGFKASERKWKTKLKEWGYLKKLSEDDMKIVVSKVDKRSREGKQTVASHAGSGITKERIKNFRKRKTVKDSNAASPSAATPACISYGTPNFECDGDLLLGDHMDRISEEPQDILAFQEQMEAPEQDNGINNPDTMMTPADGIVTWDAQSLDVQDNPFGAEATSLATIWPGSIQTEYSYSIDALHIGEPKDYLAEASDVVHARNSYDVKTAITAEAEHTFFDLPQNLQRLVLPGFRYLLNKHDIQRLANIRESSEDQAKLAIVISICVSVLDRYIKLGDPEPHKACALQFELAEALRTQNRLDESMSMYRVCVLGHERILGMSGTATLKALRCLVDILTKVGDYKDACILCHKAIVNMPVRNQKSFFEWSLSLAYIRVNVTNGYKALETLLVLLSRALNYNPIAYPLTELLKTVLESVRSAPDCLNKPRLGSSNSLDNGLLVQLLDEMVEMVRLRPLLGMELFPRLMFKAIELVKKCCSVLDLSSSIDGRVAAETLFEYGITRLKHASPKASCYEKVDIFYWYAKQLIRQRQFGKSISYLLDSWDTLVDVGRSGEPWGERVLTKIEKVLPNFLFQMSRGVESPLTYAVSVWNRIETMSRRLWSISPTHAANIGNFLHGSYTHQHLERLGTPDRTYSTVDDAETIKSMSTLQTTSTVTFKLGETLSGSEYMDFGIVDYMGPYKQSLENLSEGGYLLEDGFKHMDHQ